MAVSWTCCTWDNDRCIEMVLEWIPRDQEEDLQTDGDCNICRVAEVNWKRAQG